MSRSRRILWSAVVAVGWILVMSPTAFAGYAPPVHFGCTGFSSGGRDAAGTHYMACGDQIVITPRSGTPTAATLGSYAHHVAPSPDGSYVYAAGADGLRRFRRTSPTNYALDTTFNPQRPAGWHADWVMTGYGVATDAYGNIYFSQGWGAAPAANQILKYRPDGTLLTWFGEYGAAIEVGRGGGMFRPNTGIAVSADGSRIWVADQNNQRIQFFDRTSDNVHYAYAGMWSGEGTLWYGQLGAVYDVATDPWDRIYVTQTTTKNIWRLDRNGRNPEIVGHHRGSSDYDWSRPHTVAVDGLGRVYVGEWSQRFDPTETLPAYPTVGPEPRPDLQDPVLTSVTPAVAETTATSVRLDLVASDDIGVTKLGVVGADVGDIRHATWYAYSRAHTMQLPVIGWNGAYVAVGDAAGRTSRLVYVKVLRRPVPDGAAPTLTVTSPTTTTAASVALSVNSADNVGVTHLRVAGGDGNFGPWTAWSAGTRILQHDLRATSGLHAVTVEVRDAAYNVSNPVTVRIAFVVPTVVEPPVAATPTAPDAVAGGGLAEPQDVVAAPRDTTAPRIRTVRLPKRSCSRAVTIRLVSTDNVGLHWMRVANEDGRYGKWQRYRASLRHSLTRGATRKLVTVQVADAAGNVSRAMSVRTIVVRCGR